MFHNCVSLNNLEVSNFNIIDVKNMEYMLDGSNNLINIDLENFDTSKVT